MGISFFGFFLVDDNLVWLIRFLMCVDDVGKEFWVVMLDIEFLMFDFDIVGFVWFILLVIIV